MKQKRRAFIGQTALGLFGILPLTYLRHIENPVVPAYMSSGLQDDKTIHPLYPSTDPEEIRQVVGAAHTQFEVVKELVTARPELAKATHDWGFGDVESALGAASHMGRKDIAAFLIAHGARPNIFTFAMLGKLKAVKSMIEEMPGVQRISGPHGITLLAHAQMRLLRENVEGAEKEQQEALVDYLLTLGDADLKATSLDITSEEQKPYLGKYVFGAGENDYFEVSLNSRDMLFMSRGDYIGRVLLRTDTHSFAPGGAPSVSIRFEIAGGTAVALTVHDPTPIVKALKVN